MVPWYDKDVTCVMAFIWLWEKFSLIGSYPSMETVQVQVTLASDQSTQNCFEYLYKLALNWI